MGATGEQNPVPEPEASHVILVVEDEVLLRMMFSDQFVSGLSRMEASDADEALDLLRHDTLNIAVVISDIDMPGSINGIGLAHAINWSGP